MSLLVTSLSKQPSLRCIITASCTVVNERLHNYSTIKRKNSRTVNRFYNGRYYQKSNTNTVGMRLPYRATSTVSQQESKETSSDPKIALSPRPLTEQIIDASTIGVGQVIFLNSKTCGQIILGSLAIGDPFLVCMATLGTVTSTVTAKYIPLPSSDALTNGLYSYNGCLIGCASAVFLSSTYTTTSSLVLASTALTITGAAAAAVTTTVLNKLCPPMPQWTYAFNFVMLTALLRVQPLAPSPLLNSIDDSSSSTVVDLSTPYSPSTIDILLSPFTGISQIFVVNSCYTGIGIAAAIASYSPGLAYHALLGSSIGCLVGSCIYSVPIVDVTAGLWGYNAALTSLGVGAFFVPSMQTNVLSITGAVATSALFGAMQPIFTTTPCLTLPFCITMSACWLLGTPSSTMKGVTSNTPFIPGLILAKNPHSPEQNTP